MIKYGVIPAHPARDRNEIIAIWRRNLSSVEKLEEKFDWHFLNNPFGEGRCWLLEAGGQMAGTVSLGMRPLKLGDTDVCAGVACDFAVDAGHRLLQPALLLQKAVVQSIGPELPVVYGLPNANAAGPIRRAGYKDLSQVHRYAKPVRYSPLLRRQGAPSALAAAAGGVLDLGASLARSLHKPAGNGYVIDVLDDFDGRFDELWDRCRQKYPVIVVRNSRFLRWRYRDCPLQTYTTAGLVSPDRSRLFGYLVYYVDEGCAMCVDLLAERREESGMLLWEWLNLVRRLGVASASIHCAGAELISCLTGAGFSLRTAPPSAARPREDKHESGRILMACSTPEAASVLANPWYFTPGDEPYN